MNQIVGTGHLIGSYLVHQPKIYVSPEAGSTLPVSQCPHQNSLVASQPHAPNGAELKGQKHGSLERFSKTKASRD